MINIILGSKERWQEKEEISQSTGRDQQLPKAGDGREPGRRTAQRACTDPGDVGKIVDGKNRYVGNVIRSGIVTIDEIEELHERYNRPALFEFERPANSQVGLNVRSPAELVERGLHSVNHGAIVGGISQPVYVYRRGERKRAGALRLGDGRELETSRYIKSSR